MELFWFCSLSASRNENLLETVVRSILQILIIFLMCCHQNCPPNGGLSLWAWCIIQFYGSDLPSCLSICFCLISLVDGLSASYMIQINFQVDRGPLHLQKSKVKRQLNMTWRRTENTFESDCSYWTQLWFIKEQVLFSEEVWLHLVNFSAHISDMDIAK